MEEIENPRSVMRVYGDKMFDFGIGLKLLKYGYRIYRKSWETGVWVCLQKGYPDGIPINKNTADATGIQHGTVCSFLPYLMQKTASPEATFTHWQPTHADILAENYMIAW